MSIPNQDRLDKILKQAQGEIDRMTKTEREAGFATPNTILALVGCAVPAMESYLREGEPKPGEMHLGGHVYLYLKQIESLAKQEYLGQKRPPH